MPKADIVCKLTGETGRPIKAHIIPKSLYQLEGRPGYLIKKEEGQLPKRQRSPMGQYDETILTGTGENYFEAVDGYAAKFFLNKGGFNDGKVGVYHTLDGEQILLELPEAHVDEEKMRLFFLSVLWRAGISKRPFFSEIFLGPHESRIRDRILDKDPGPADDYLMIMGKYIDTPEKGFPIQSPVRKRICGLNFYRLYFPKFFVDIKVTSRVCPDFLSEAALGPKKPMLIWLDGYFKDTARYKEVQRVCRELFETGCESDQSSFT